MRPKLMTVAAAFLGLLPAMLAIGAGSDVAKRIVAPMIGGLVSSFLLELLIYPPLYFLWKGGPSIPPKTP
jgi:copper/silver efflux system protein